MVLTLALGLSGGAYAAFDKGTGTADDPYVITTAAQLKEFRDLVNGGSNKLCAQLGANIDLNNEPWTPIGLSSSGYCGTFEGGGYAIRNLMINGISKGTSSGSTTIYGGGLFGIVGKTGAVRRLNVAGTVTMDGSYSKNPDVGMICGGNLGIIEECFATVNFTATEMKVSSGSGRTNFGGIAGVNSGTIRNCYTVGTMNMNVTAGSSTSAVNAGGIVGYIMANGSTIENCYSAVTIKLQSNRSINVGGIIGMLNATGTFNNLYTNKDTCAALAGTNASRLKNSQQFDTAYMKTPAFAAILGSAFDIDSDKVNQGYPVLRALAYEEEENHSGWFGDEVLSTEEDKEIFSQLTPAELLNKDLTKSITRLEFCAVAVQLYEEMGQTKLSAEGLPNPFTDTGSDAVKKAYALGITDGMSETTFEPYTLISREQLATMLTRVYKALNLPGWTLATDSSYALDYSGTRTFADDEYISAYAKPSVYFMAKNGIVGGMTETTFAPKNLTPYETAIGYANASREQAIIMAVRMFKKL